MEDFFHVATSGLDITPRQFLSSSTLRKRRRSNLSQTDLVQTHGMLDSARMAEQTVVMKPMSETATAEDDRFASSAKKKRTTRVHI